MNRRSVAPVLALLAALPLASCIGDDPQPLEPAAPQLARQGYPGSYEVGFTSYVIQDAARANRPIAVYLWYPVSPASITYATPEAQYPLEPFLNGLPVATSADFEDYGLGRAYQEPEPAAGPFPLIMYSTGWQQSAYSGALFIGTEVARHGIALAAVTHWGDRGGPVPPASEPLDHLSLAAYNRPRDISVALTDLLGRNDAEGDLLSGVIDPMRVIASGWSLGGYAAMVLAAGDDGVCDLTDVFPGWPQPPEACGPTAPDPRITAIIPLDGSGQALHFAELARVHVPALGMGEEWSVLEAQSPGFEAWQARNHAGYSGHPSYRVDVARTVHFSFSNWCEAVAVWADHGITPWQDPTGDYTEFWCNPPNMAPAELHRLVNKYIVAFLASDQAILTAGHALTHEPDIEFFVTEKRNPNAIDQDWPADFTYFKHQPGRATSSAIMGMAAKDPPGPRSMQFGQANGHGP